MPKSPRTAIARVIADKLSSSLTGRELSRKIAAYLVAEGRERELESIVRDVMALREQDGIVEAQVRVARALTADELTKLREFIRSEFTVRGTVLISQTIDRRIVGGLRIDTAHQQLDLTVRGKLDAFKRLTSQGKLS